MKTFITKFKKFESLNTDPADDLIDQLGESFVEEYYDDNANHDIEEIIYIWPDVVWNNIDDDRFVESWIDDEIENRSLEDIDEDDLKKYIQNNYSETKENKILELYIDNKGLDSVFITSNISGKISFEKNKKGKTIIVVTSDDGQFQKYAIPVDYNIVVNENDIVDINDTLAKLEFDDFMLDDLTDDDLRIVIEENNEEEDCIREIVEGWHKGQGAQELIEDIYGKLEGKELYNVVQNYIDDDAIIQDYKDNESYDYKVDYIKSAIPSDRNLQQKILDLDPKNSILLANIFSEDGHSGNFIGDEYDFQKAYIDSKIKKFLEDEGYDENETDEELKQEIAGEISHVRAKALKFLHEEFSLDPEIETEHEDDLWLIKSSTYNL